MNKPLTKEERESIYEYDDPVEKALSAEAYWREAVKNARFVIEDYCSFCDIGIAHTGEHATDCPWLLAQE